MCSSSCNINYSYLNCKYWVLTNGIITTLHFQILNALKSCLLRTFREEEHASQSRWLRESWGTDCDVTTAFMTTVDNCVMGWDQVR